MASNLQKIEAHRESDGSFVMTEALVSEICKQKGFYRLPELNEKLYLHYMGFSRIQNLGAFANCQALWIENNMITVLENLEELTSLRTIFAQHNQISGFIRKDTISNDENSKEVKKHADPANTLMAVLNRNTINNTTCGQLFSVRSINLSNNVLESLTGISIIFPNLETLIVSHNRLKHYDSSEISNLQSLTVLDLSYNLIASIDRELRDDLPHLGEYSFIPLVTSFEREVFSSLKSLQKLASIIFTGNPFVRSVNNYRKKLICYCNSIQFIDEMPVFPDERETSIAFGCGGRANELVKKNSLKAQERKTKVDNERRFDLMLQNNEEEETFSDIYIQK